MAKLYTTHADAARAAEHAHQSGKVVVIATTYRLNRALGVRVKVWRVISR